jgi:uncharacterized protein (TIGR02246 family)
MRYAARVMVPIAVLCFSATAGCKKQHDAAPAHAPDGKAWAGTTERWSQDWNAKRLEPVLAAYAPDAVFLTATGARVAGHAQIREVFKRAFASATTDMRLRATGGDASGDLAYETGDYEESIAGETGRRELKGSYVTILKRGTDGRWLIVQHAWTEAAPPR